MRFFAPVKLSENIHETPEGFLFCIGVPIGRVGEMVYAPGETPIEPGPDGKVYITRTAAELFRPETIASFECKSLTIQHPEEFVAPENWQELTCGVVQNVHQGTGEGEDPDDLLADILVTDAEAITAVKNGLREVSCGYEAEYAETGPGRAEQRNIIGNHLALVEQGRAGASYAINDHKNGGKGARLIMKKKTFKEFLGLVSKVNDAAAELAAEDAAFGAAEKEEAPAKDAGTASYDELVSVVKDLAGKVEALSGGKKEEKPAAPAAAGKDESNPAAPAEAGAGEQPAAAPSVEDRLAALEATVAKLMEGEALETEAEFSGEESFGDESGEEEEAEDAIEETATLTGDTAARVEILAPGFKAKDEKSAKSQALQASYQTADGKAAIDKFTGGVAPTKLAAPMVEAVFIGASELLKGSRENQLARTKTQDSGTQGGARAAMTPEKMNELNAALYPRK